MNVEVLAIDLFCAIAAHKGLLASYARSRASAWIAGVRDEKTLGQTCRRYMPVCRRMAEDIVNMEPK